MQVFHNHPYLVAYSIFYNGSCSLVGIHQVCEERQELMRNSPVSTIVYTIQNTVCFNQWKALTSTAY